jgi:hypothetical protein
MKMYGEDKLGLYLQAVYPQLLTEMRVPCGFSYKAVSTPKITSKGGLSEW